MALSILNMIVSLMTLSVLSIMMIMGFLEYELAMARVSSDVCPDSRGWDTVGSLIKGRMLRQMNNAIGGSGGISDDIGESVSNEERYVPVVPRRHIPKGANINDEVIKRLTAQELRIYWDALGNLRKRTGMAFKHLAPSQKWGVAEAIMNSFGYQQRLPDVINIGAKKCATTPLKFFLGFHPDIVNTITGRSIEFFDKNYERESEWYRRNMGFAKEGQLVFEKTPNYLIAEDVPERMSRVLSARTQFILTVRDPVERAISDFRHTSELRKRLDWCTKQTEESEALRFEEAIFTESGEIDPDSPYISASNYARHLKRWLQHFSKGQFLILDHELVVGYTFRELERIEKFLNVSSYFRPEMFEFDSVIPGTCIKYPKRQCPGRGSRGTLPKARPSNQTVRKLREFFRPFNVEFSQLVGRTFHWTNY